MKNWDAPRYRKSNKFPKWKWLDGRRNAKQVKSEKAESQEKKEEA